MTDASGNALRPRPLTDYRARGVRCTLAEMVDPWNTARVRLCRNHWNRIRPRCAVIS